MPRSTALLPVFIVLASCSPKKYAINQLGDALAGTGTTFASDDDPELIRGALPFSLKLIESLLAKARATKGCCWQPAADSRNTPTLLSRKTPTNFRTPTAPAPRSSVREPPSSTSAPATTAFADSMCATRISSRA